MDIEQGKRQAVNFIRKTVREVDEMEIDAKIKEFTEDTGEDSSSESESSSSSVSQSLTDDDYVNRKEVIAIEKIEEVIRKSTAEQMKSFQSAFCKQFFELQRLSQQSTVVRPTPITFEPLPQHFPTTFVKQKLNAKKWMDRWLKKGCIVSRHAIKKKGKGRKGTKLPAPFKNYEVLIWPSIWPPEPHSTACKKLRTFQAGSRGHRYIRCLPVDVKKQTAFLRKFKKAETKHTATSPVLRKKLSKS